jgi:hypothetical protein
MGQFKPMVKMETTEPSVELKLKKGGKVVKKADGGMMGSPMSADMPPSMPARGGMPMAGSPMKPSLAMRRRAMRGMPAGAGPAGPVGGAASMQPAMPAPAMKKGGKAEGGESKKTHMAEMSKMKGLEKELKSHESKPASKGHKGLKTGGVVNGQGGFKKGGAIAKSGIINTEGQGGKYRDTMMHTAKPDHSPAKTGGVKLGNGGGYKKGGMAKGGDCGYATGGVAKSNGGGYKNGGKIKGMMDGGMAGDGMMDGGMMDNGMSPYGTYKKGGSAKKAYAAGGTVNSGRPVAMPQGRKPAPKPVRINELAGTYKAGGKVTPAEGRLQKISKAENAPAFRAAKKDTNEKYGSASMKKFSDGGPSAKGAVTEKERKTMEDLSGGAYDKTGKVNRDLEDALNPLSMVKELAGKAKNYFMPKGSDSVTKTKESVTVTPAKKRGGSVKC